MDPRHRDLLRVHRVFLINELHIDDDFLSVFMAADLFTQSMYQQIRNNSTGSRKAATFLDLLVRRGPNAFPVLIEALVDTKLYHVADKLDPDLAAQLRGKKPALSSEEYAKPELTTQLETIKPVLSSGEYVQEPKRPRLQPVSGHDEQPIMSDLIRQRKKVSDTFIAAALKEVELGVVYNLSKGPRGRALIINNYEFKAPLQHIEGAAFDSLNLCEMFESLFFTTVLHENVTSKELKELLLKETTRPEHEDADAFVLWILSHGARGQVYGVDGGALDVDEDIIQMFSGQMCPNLVNKPKIIIIQACQGNEGARSVTKTNAPLTGEDLLEEEKTSASLKNLAIGDTKDLTPGLNLNLATADMLVVYTICSDYNSFRQTTYGSWFVRAFVKQICAHAHKEDILAILARVGRAGPGLESYSSLCKKLYFLPGYVDNRVDNVDGTTPQPSIDTLLMDADMRQLFLDACSEGVRKVFRSRIMLLGHRDAGKTSVKRSLMHEEFISEHLSTDGIETGDQTCVVNVDTAVNWKKGCVNYKADLTGEMARQSISSQILVAQSEDAPDEETDGASPTNIGISAKPAEDVKNVQTKVEQIELTPDIEQRLNEMKTEVVNVKATLPQDPGVEVMFNIWDFGGQHVYYTSHQTFLSSRAIYLLVMDVTRQLDEVLETCHRTEGKRWKDSGEPRTPREVMDFWLNSVHTHLRRRCKTEGEAQSPTVIMVLTKTDLPEEATEEERKIKVQDYIEKLEECIDEGSVYRDHVHWEMMTVSNRKDVGIDDLRLKIMEVASKEPYWGEPHPTKWLLLADELDKQRHSRGDYPVMPYAEVEETAQKLGVQKQETKAFLAFHHLLGDIIYFDEEGIRDTVILCPQWLGNVFRTVITQDQILEKRLPDPEQRVKLKRGILLQETAEALCPVPTAKQQMPGTVPEARVLVKIMETFDMLTPCETKVKGKEVQAYLVPCLMQRVPNEQVKTRDEKVPCIHFKFAPLEYQDSDELDTMGFLPHGLFHRVVSRCCRSKMWEVYEKTIFYDFIELGVQDFCFSLGMVYNGITLSAFKFAREDRVQLKYSMELTEIRKTIQTMIEQVTSEVFPNLVCIPFLLCTGQCGKTSDVAQEPGFIRPSHNQDDIRGECSHRCGGVDTKLWAMWFQDCPGTHESLDSLGVYIPISVKDVPAEEAERHMLKDNVFPMRGRTRGRVLIINNVDFEDPMKLASRGPSIHDVSNLTALFEEGLHFKVKPEENLTAQEMRKCILEESRRSDHNDYEAFFLCIMSHGRQGSILGTDGEEVSISKDIIEPFHQDRCENLRGKPKVFLFQACEAERSGNVPQPPGGAGQTGEGINTGAGVSAPAAVGGGDARPADMEEHALANILEVSSTAPGDLSWKGDNGSWFIRTFVYEVVKSAHILHLADILIDVRRSVQKQRDVDQHMQLPHTRKDTLLRRLYFFPGYPPPAPV